MGLRNVLARTAAGSAHALVIEVPGWWRTRVAVEGAVLARGWRLSFSPADADVLVVCGEPGPQLAGAIDLVWHQMPGPRVRIEVVGPHDVAAGLDGAHAGLLDHLRHRHDAHRRPTAADLLGQRANEAGTDRADEGDAGHGAHDDMAHEHPGDDSRGDTGDHEQAEGHAQMSHEDVTQKEASHASHEGQEHPGDHGGHGDHGGDGEHGGHGHGGHGHGDMEMAPGGIPLAEGGEDRDRLEMDVLSVRLGPVLPHWPPGLVLGCSLQGDVIVEARGELVDGTPEDLSESVVVADRARRLDGLSSLLALAGWEDAAAQARRLRDAALEPGDRGLRTAELDRLCRRVRRSRVLRWSLRGIGVVSVDEIHRRGLPAATVGDTYDRLLWLLDRARAEVGDDGARAGQAPTVFGVAQVAQLVVGLDLATARLVIASLDVHALGEAHVGHGVSHG